MAIIPIHIDQIIYKPDPEKPEGMAKVTVLVAGHHLNDLKSIADLQSGTIEGVTQPGLFEVTKDAAERMGVTDVERDERGNVTIHCDQGKMKKIGEDGEPVEPAGAEEPREGEEPAA